MTPPPPAKASLEVGEDTDMRDGENEASAIDNDEGLDTSLLYQIPKIKKPKRIEKSSPQKMEIHIMEEDEEKHAAGYDSDGNCGVHMSEAVRKEWAEAADVDNADGIYVLQGLSPSPRVEYKFHRLIDDPVNGNDYVYY